MPRISLLLWLIGSIAQAQTSGALTIIAAQGTASAYNQAACQSNPSVSFEWSIGTDPTQGSQLPNTLGNTYQLDVWSPGSGGTCPAAGTQPTCSPGPISCATTITSSTPNIVTTSLGTIYNWNTADGGSGSCPADQSLTFPVCFGLSVTNNTGIGTSVTYYEGSFSIAYDSAPPNPPSLSIPVEGDQRVVAAWTTDVTSPAGFTVYWVPAALGTPSGCATPTPDGGFASSTDPAVDSHGVQGAATSYEIDTYKSGALTDDQPYEIWATVTDPAGNVSGDSQHCYATPHKICDFWCEYHQQGGRDSGGCGYPGSPLPLLGVLALLRRPRRRDR